MTHASSERGRGKEDAKRKEVERIVLETFKQFPYKIKLPAVLFLDKKTFSKYLSDMKLEKHVDKTPCFVAHLPEGECLCFCMKVISNFVKGRQAPYTRLFIRAITLHELYHIYNHHRIDSAEEAVKSEEEVHEEIRHDFPEIARILEHIEKGRLS